MHQAGHDYSTRKSQPLPGMGSWGKRILARAHPGWWPLNAALQPEAERVQARLRGGIPSYKYYAVRYDAQAPESTGVWAAAGVQPLPISRAQTEHEAVLCMRALSQCNSSQLFSFAPGSPAPPLAMIDRKLLHAGCDRRRSSQEEITISSLHAYVHTAGLVSRPCLSHFPGLGQSVSSIHALDRFDTTSVCPNAGPQRSPLCESCLGGGRALSSTGPGPRPGKPAVRTPSSFFLRNPPLYRVLPSSDVTCCFRRDGRLRYERGRNITVVRLLVRFPV